MGGNLAQMVSSSTGRTGSGRRMPAIKAITLISCVLLLLGSMDQRPGRWGLRFAEGAMRTCESVKREACQRVKDTLSPEGTSCTVRQVVDCCNGNCNDLEVRPLCEGGENAIPAGADTAFEEAGVCTTYAAPASSTYWWGIGADGIAPTFQTFKSTGCLPIDEHYTAEGSDDCPSCRSRTARLPKCDVVMWALSSCYDATLTGYEAIAKLQADCENTKAWGENDDPFAAAAA